MYKFDAEKHVHTLNGSPLIGASTVGSVLAKPLTWWAAGLALEPLGWTKIRDGKKFRPKEPRLKAAGEKLEELKKLETSEYLKLLDLGYRAHSETLKTTAEAGADRHAIVEKWVKLMMVPNPVDPPMTSDELESISSFIEWCRANVKKFLWSEVNCYSEKHWVGGISDIGCELNDGKIAIIDIKSSKEAYPSQFFQCAGYDLCISENGGFNADGERTMDIPKPIEAHIIFPFGAKEPTAVVNYDVVNNRRAFLAELFLYKQLQAFERDI